MRQLTDSTRESLSFDRQKLRWRLRKWRTRFRRLTTDGAAATVELNPRGCANSGRMWKFNKRNPVFASAEKDNDN